MNLIVDEYVLEITISLEMALVTINGVKSYGTGLIFEWFLASLFVEVTLQLHMFLVVASYWE